MWRPEGKAVAPYALMDIDADLRRLCAEHERPINVLTAEQRYLIPERAYTRAARYLQRIHTHGFPAHSRVIERFIHDSFVPHGRSHKGSGHREHVVPCVLIRDEAVSMFRKSESLESVMIFINKNTVIVEIAVDEQKRLDTGKDRGGYGLKTHMPSGRIFKNGCIFARLHSANIDFDPPPGFGRCHPDTCRSLKECH